MKVFASTEFWSAVAGAVVGGLITFLCQLYALRKARQEREADHSATQKALANSLVFKLMRMHSNLHGMHRHFLEGMNEGEKELPGAEPWQVVRPLANPPIPIHLQSDEMGMLLSLKNDNALNGVFELEATHNSLIAAVEAFNTERIALGERIASLSEMEAEAGDRITNVTATKHKAVLRPMMIGVNSLARQILAMGKDGLAESLVTLRAVEGLFRTKLGVAYSLSIKQPADAEGPKN